MVIKTLLKPAKLWMLWAPLFLLFLAADQLTKVWAVRTLDPYASLRYAEDIGFFLSHNDGIAFGIALPTWLIFLLSMALLTLGAYLVLSEKLWQDKWHLLGIALIAAGAIGNLIDRVRLGYVIDFIRVYWWPHFNVADAWIVIGVFLLSWRILLDKGEAKSV